MISQKKCIPCQGGIPPLNESEINSLIKEIDVGWKVFDGVQLRKEYIFKLQHWFLIYFVEALGIEPRSEN